MHSGGLAQLNVERGVAVLVSFLLPGANDLTPGKEIDNHSPALSPLWKSPWFSSPPAIDAKLELALIIIISMHCPRK